MVGSGSHCGTSDFQLFVVSKTMPRYGAGKGVAEGYVTVRSSS